MSAPAKQYATSQDWDRLQSVIMRLYLDEDKTLEEVKLDMERDHEFFATISMYKKKFTAWGAFKNLRLDEVLQVLRLKKDRDAAQKASQFFIRDREVDHNSLQVYLSRNPSVFARLEAGDTPNPEAVRDVTCRTPRPSSTLPYRQPSPSPKCPSPTVQCNRLSPVPEDMFRALHIYLDQCFDSGLWSWSDSHCWNTRGRYGPSGLLSSVLDRCITAALAVSRQVEPVAIRRALDVPFAMLIRVFRNPPPILIPKLISAAAHLNRIGRGEIGGLLLQFSRDLTVAIFGQDHPLARFWKGLISIPHLERQDAMGRILTLCVSEFDTRLGPAHPLTTEAYLKYFDTVEREKDPRVQLQSLEHQLSKIDVHRIGGSLLGLLKLEHALANCKLNLEQRRLDKAEEALSHLDASFLAARDESFRCVWLGYIKCIKGDLRAAERFYKNSVLAAKQTGSRDCVLEALYQLETFFLHAGKPLEAEQVRAERFRLHRKLDSLIWTDREDIPSSRDRNSDPMVMIVHIASDESGAAWQPSAFAEVTEYARVSGSVP
ncbi:hypothetical protein F4776DRAFT_590626 [Hypoxylon sp. NC0597]|nr:hypothetical protein F4776DRAFT_590626 [Hypoxylon sp. NC0597]